MHALQGQTAIVTGGAVRLGRALAERLAREGIDICLQYSSSRCDAEEAVLSLQRHGVRATSVQADFRDVPAAAERVLTHAVQVFGRVDVLVNSAAVFEPGTLADTDAANWDRHQNINLKAPVFLCREFAKQLPLNGTGHIVNLLDWRALRPGAGHLAYTVSKAGLAAATQILAQELGPRIQVNAIAPGAILPARGDSHARFAAVGQRTPLQRTGTPEDVAEALVYLLRSEFVTGEILHVTGGEQL